MLFAGWEVNSRLIFSCRLQMGLFTLARRLLTICKKSSERAGVTQILDKERRVKRVRSILC